MVNRSKQDLKVSLFLINYEKIGQKSLNQTSQNRLDCGYTFLRYTASLENLMNNLGTP